MKQTLTFEIEDGKAVINLAAALDALEKAIAADARCPVCDCRDTYRDANDDLCCANCDTLIYPVKVCPSH